MRWLGESRTVAVAAGLNAVLGSTVLVWHFMTGERRSARTYSLSAHFEDGLAAPDAEGADDRSRHKPAGIEFPSAFITAVVAGFVSLGYEIVWYRLFSFTTGGIAKSFAFLLGAYLAGIGLGSLASNRVCRTITNPQTFIRFLVRTVLGANLLGFLIRPILFKLVVHVSSLWTLVPISLAAALLGAIFPLLCHISLPPDQRAARA